MILTRSADYALRALIYLAQASTDQPVPLDAIASAQQVPPALLSKILQNLVRGGLVRSRKGYGGGYLLVAKPSELSLHSVIELIDGPFTVFECLVDEGFCELCSSCKLRQKFTELQVAMVGILDKTTIADCLPDGRGTLLPSSRAQES